MSSLLGYTDEYFRDIIIQNILKIDDLESLEDYTFDVENSILILKKGETVIATFSPFNITLNNISFTDTTIDGDLYVTGNVSIGVTTANELLQIHESTSGDSRIQFTNVSTGTTGTDGFLVGINSSEQAVLINQENTDMIFYTNDTESYRINVSQQIIATNMNLTNLGCLGGIVLSQLNLANMSTSSFAHNLDLDFNSTETYAFYKLVFSFELPAVANCTIWGRFSDTGGSISGTNNYYTNTATSGGGAIHNVLDTMMQLFSQNTLSTAVWYGSGSLDLRLSTSTNFCDMSGIFSLRTAAAGGRTSIQAAYGLTSSATITTRITTLSFQASAANSNLTIRAIRMI